VERAELVPLARVRREVARRLFRSFGLDGGETRGVGGDPWATPEHLRPPFEQSEDRLDQPGLAEAQEDPIAFLAAGQQAAIEQYLHVLGDARLALRQDLRDFADSQLHLAQELQNPQARGVGEGLE